MKKQTLLQTAFGIIIIAALSSGCQKAPSKSARIADSANNEIANPEQIPSNICSAEMMEKRKTFQLTELKILSVHEKMTTQQTTELKNSYREEAQKQVESCAQLIGQFTKEKITSCLKTETPKSQENAFYKDVLEAKCKTVIEWEKAVTPSKNLVENLAAPIKKPKSIVLQLTPAAMELIQEKNAAEFRYLVKAEIKYGKENYIKDARAGETTCTLSSPAAISTNSEAKESSQESLQASAKTLSKTSLEPLQKKSTLNYIAESQASDQLTNQLTGQATQNALGFEDKGENSVITFQDSSGMIISMLCLNQAISSESDRATALRKHFGRLANVQEFEKMDPRLNADLAPTVKPTEEKVAEKNAEIEKVAAEKEKGKAIEQTIEKARETIQVVLKESLAEIKKTSLEVAEESIGKTQKASESIVTSAVAQSKVAASEIVNSSVTKAEASAAKVIDQAIAKATIAAEQVSEKTIAAAKSAGTELITESKIAANEVVDQGITKAKLAAVETVTSPFTWIGKTASSAWDGFAGFFSSGDKKQNKTVDIRKAIRK